VPWRVVMAGRTAGPKALVPSSRWKRAGLIASWGGVSATDRRWAASTTIAMTASLSAVVANRRSIVCFDASAMGFQWFQTDRSNIRDCASRRPSPFGAATQHRCSLPGSHSGHRWRVPEHRSSIRQRSAAFRTWPHAHVPRFAARAGRTSARLLGQMTRTTRAGRGGHAHVRSAHRRTRASAAFPAVESREARRRRSTTLGQAPNPRAWRRPVPHWCGEHSLNR
jgi:hypothetical protein